MDALGSPNNHYRLRLDLACDAVEQALEASLRVVPPLAYGERSKLLQSWDLLLNLKYVDNGS